MLHKILTFHPIKNPKPPNLPQIIHRTLALWSSTKDPDLESSLSRNRRWIVNNQIKNIILRQPNQSLPISDLQKKFKTLDLQGKALNWLKKYPCCFEIESNGVNGERICRLKKRMMELVEEEEEVRVSGETAMVRRLAKVLMMSVNRRLNVAKISELKRNLGLPDNYLISVVPTYPDFLRVVNYSGRRHTMEIELSNWHDELAVSVIESKGREGKREPCFSCLLPETWVMSRERFHEFNSTPYISPYDDVSGLVEGSRDMEKRVVGLIHELLSLTWRKMSIIKLGHFKREFGLPEKLNVFLLKHPGIFYFSNRYQIYTGAS